MYGMPGHRFGKMIEVINPNEMPELVKEAQMSGMSARTFVIESKEILLAFDGMFLVDTRSGEIVEEKSFETRRVFTQSLS